MKRKQWIKNWLVASVALAAIASCSKKDSSIVDTEYPSIDVSASNSFPKQCSEIQRGQKFIAMIHVSDNKELGSLNVDIHHNFDHHSHSTEVNDCSLNPVQTPVNPLVLIKSISVPAGQTKYVAQQEIEIPADIDPGDYHFLIRITDKEGWQTIKGLSIKIK
ncbi:DUF4625 domain-containing protein [Niabella ginsengisoli]|uniref:DUF4625 domain-containing protein n=1 Tax=Niabella ginsengisoli TaxID=522298 RepID=A0ABS9SR12_9BACT|nr:DUF4625 domain-containing protein [Niabella ginsengisoli]MCH5600824.1 DUF4625 domain-containing protein [Niabella ginsengisoli]